MRIFAITALLFLAACTTERSRGRASSGEVSIEDLLDAGLKSVDASRGRDGEPSAEEDGSIVTRDARVDGGPQCVPFDPPPPAGPCTATAWECLVAANGDEAAFDACFAEHPACNQCIDDHFNDCLVGTIAEPGPCQSERFCFLGCLIHDCQEDDINCLNAAATDECGALAEDFNACGRNPRHENACADFAITNCRPGAG